jgi:hypothetical protein
LPGRQDANTTNATQIQPRPLIMLKKKALNAERVRKEPATPINAEPATMAAVRVATTGMPWPSAACGFSPTMRTASPAGVRCSSHHEKGTSSSASSVSVVCCEMIGSGSHSIGANGTIVGGVLTLGKATR